MCRDRPPAGLPHPGCRRGTAAGIPGPASVFSAACAGEVEDRLPIPRCPQLFQGEIDDAEHDGEEECESPGMDMVERSK